ncbi:hypothetical protein GFY24_12175 [Nocardia sp. SYP-A9097]|nr:hypothetical protein [Nocardia sp. SYP-A9097]
MRACLVHDIDCWVASRLPIAHGGARRHTESVGVVIDRLARFWVLAHATLKPGTDPSAKCTTPGSDWPNWRKAMTTWPSRYPSAPADYRIWAPPTIPRNDRVRKRRC